MNNRWRCSKANIQELRGKIDERERQRNNIWKEEAKKCPGLKTSPPTKSSQHKQKYNGFGSRLDLYNRTEDKRKYPENSKKIKNTRGFKQYRWQSDKYQVPKENNCKPRLWERYIKYSFQKNELGIFPSLYSGIISITRIMGSPKTNESKIWFFAKIHKIDKYIVRKIKEKNEILKIRMEINKIENRNTTEKMNEVKSCFFEKRKLKSQPDW